MSQTGEVKQGAVCPVTPIEFMSTAMRALKPVPT